MEEAREHPAVTTHGDDEDPALARQRLRGFIGHLMGYFIGMILIVPLNLFFTPERIWFVFPMVGWGGILAVHVAYVMGMFGGKRRGR